MVNHFSQNVDAILEDISVTETIVWCYHLNCIKVPRTSDNAWGGSMEPL